MTRTRCGRKSPAVSTSSKWATTKPPRAATSDVSTSRAPTLRALEEALVAFPGCAVVISHDRWFLDRIATHILAFEGDSQVMWFEGNYQEYVEDFKKRKGEDAFQPHRIRYKPLAG